jgi:hypothetical protein
VVFKEGETSSADIEFPPKRSVLNQRHIKLAKARGKNELGIVEFRAEFFNVFNNVNFGLPSNTVLGSGFGIISKTAGPSRQIQFSLKLIY